MSDRLALAVFCGGPVSKASFDDNNHHELDTELLGRLQGHQKGQSAD